MERYIRNAESLKDLAEITECDLSFPEGSERITVKAVKQKVRIAGIHPRLINDAKRVGYANFMAVVPLNNGWVTSFVVGGDQSSGTSVPGTPGRQEPALAIQHAENIQIDDCCIPCRSQRHVVQFDNEFVEEYRIAARISAQKTLDREKFVSNAALAADAKRVADERTDRLFLRLPKSADGIQRFAMNCSVPKSIGIHFTAQKRLGDIGGEVNWFVFHADMLRVIVTERGAASKPSGAAGGAGGPSGTTEAEEDEDSIRFFDEVNRLPFRPSAFD